MQSSDLPDFRSASGCPNSGEPGYVRETDALFRESLANAFGL
jgi:hypothetical protein